jgi:transposase
VVHNDDTTMKILQLMKENAQRDDEGAGAGRTGMFTSGVVALCGGVKIALFFSGRQHAGENLAEVLKHQAEELEPPIQMCDALSRNASEELATILANCLAHARREFVDIYDSFPDECRRVLEAFKVIYKNDKTARQEGLSAEERLALHQRASQPTMTALKTWLDQQIEEKLVEPNSALGGAIAYLRNHWEPLTLFLRKAGAPLDNNICERALKKAILHRKNSYFYKTLRGAKVGDAYMSLIYTCELCGENAFEYLTALHSHAEAVAVDPSSWLPWTYRETMSSLDSAEAGETS